MYPDTFDDAEVDALIRQFDADGSGTIDWLEFLYMMSKKMSSDQEEDSYQTIFKFFDKDESGVLEVEEFINSFFPESGAEGPCLVPP